MSENRFPRKSPVRETRGDSPPQRPPVSDRRGPRFSAPSTRTLLPSAKRLSYEIAVSIGAIRAWWRRLRASGDGQVSPWAQINPSGRGQNAWSIDVDLNGVAIVDDNTIVAVGNRGVIIRSSDFGATWAQSASGTHHDLYGVAFADTARGLAVGDWGVILLTSDGGVTWSDITPGEIWSTRDVDIHPNADGTNHVEVLPGRDYCLRGVAFSWNDLGRAIVVGDVNGIRALMLGNAAPGSSWTRWRDLSDWSCGPLADVAFSDRSVIAVGGNPWLVSDALHYSFTYSLDDGDTWHQPASAPCFAFGGVAFSDSDRAFAVSPFETVETTSTGGDNWHAIAVPLTFDCGRTPLADVAFGTINDGYIVGDYGAVMRTADAGGHWNQLPRQTRLMLRAVDARGAQRAVAVGHGFTAFTTTDGGQTWGGRATLTLSDLRGVSFAGPLNGIIVGDRGDMFRTTDGGVVWRPLNVTVQGLSQWPWNDVAMLDANTAVAVGPNMDPEGCIVRTTDGGATWTQVLAPTASGSQGHLWSISFCDALHGMALGATRVLTTTDGGVSWAENPLPFGSDLRAIRCVTPAVAFAVGAAGLILRTTDGGATWQVLSSGVSYALLGLWFIDTNRGWVVGFDGESENIATDGVILHTIDGGNTWQRQASGVALPLRSVSFADAYVGTAVGGKGWENYTGAEDPVVLRTENGGVTWTRQQLGADAKSLYRVVMIDRLVEVAIGRRGTIIRTTTGGL